MNCHLSVKPNMLISYSFFACVPNLMLQILAVLKNFGVITKVTLLPILRIGFNWAIRNDCNHYHVKWKVKLSFVSKFVPLWQNYIRSRQTYLFPEFIMKVERIFNNSIEWFMSSATLIIRHWWKHPANHYLS